MSIISRIFGNGVARYCSYCGMLLEKWRTDDRGEWYGCSGFRSGAIDAYQHSVRYTRTRTPRRFDEYTGKPK